MKTEREFLEECQAKVARIVASSTLATANAVAKELASDIRERMLDLIRQEARSA